MRPVKRIRGAVMRLVRDRRVALGLGLLLVLPALWLGLGDYAFETWWTDGAALVLGATGLAVMLAGLGGRRPDWIDSRE